MTGPDITLSTAQVGSISNPTPEATVVTVQVPGVTGPTGAQGAPGQANVLTIGTIATGAAGSNASATISGVSPNQVLNLTIPQGPAGAAGADGPANTLTIGTVNTVSGTANGSATITGTSPNQILNLTLPRGYGVIPAGSTGDVLVKNSGTDYDTKWSTPSSSSSTVSNLMSRDASGQSGASNFWLNNTTPNDGNGQWATRKDYVDGQDATMRRPIINNQTANYTLALTDERKIVQMNISSAATLTVPANSSVAFPLGTVIDVTYLGTGGLSVTPAAGVTISGSSNTISITRANALFRLVKIGTDSWQGDKISLATAGSISTASTLVLRDASGRASVADPSVSTDIATKNYVDTGDALAVKVAGDIGGTAASPQVTGGTHHTHTSSQISDAASAATASKVIIRDANGRASVADPSASTDIATKNYVDSGDTNSALHPSSVWSSATTGNTSVGQWWKIATVTIAAQFIESEVGLLVVASGESGSNEQQARVTFRVRQNLALASAPSLSTTVYSVVADSAAVWTNANFLTVTETNNSSQTVVSLWVQNNQSFSTLYAYEEFKLGAGTFAYAANGSAGVVTGSLPAGTQTTAVYGAGDLALSTATSASTASTLVKRDANGRASVADPSASTDIATKNYVDTQDLAVRRPAINSQTASYTLALTDEAKLIQVNSSSATSVTVPLNSSVAFPVGAIIDVQMLGTGAVTISPTAGVTVLAAANALTLTRVNAIVRLQKTATDTWSANGMITASATAQATVSTLVLRDSSGRASVADPSASTDIATKNYVDTKLAGKITVGTVAPSSPATNDIWIDTN